MRWPFDDHRIALDGHFARELAVGRVVARQMGIGLRVAQVVDRDDLDLVRALRLEQRAQNVSSDTAVAVDAHLDSHVVRGPLYAGNHWGFISEVVRPASPHYRP